MSFLKKISPTKYLWIFFFSFFFIIGGNLPTICIQNKYYDCLLSITNFKVEFLNHDRTHNNICQDHAIPFLILYVCVTYDSTLLKRHGRPNHETYGQDVTDHMFYPCTLYLFLSSSSLTHTLSQQNTIILTKASRVATVTLKHGIELKPQQQQHFANPGLTCNRICLTRPVLSFQRFFKMSVNDWSMPSKYMWVCYRRLHPSKRIHLSVTILYKISAVAILSLDLVIIANNNAYHSNRAVILPISVGHKNRIPNLFTSYTYPLFIGCQGGGCCVSSVRFVAQSFLNDLEISSHLVLWGHEEKNILKSDSNGHVVAAFEQSLANMTARLQHLTATAEQKDSELNELRDTIELLRNRSAEAGLISRQNGESSHLNPHISRRHTFNNSDKSDVTKENTISRQLSTDSVSSLSSACSLNSSTSRQSS
ncbi:Protein sickie [Nymphon striatum]|nr:Protein sickie [Nymphon striatum]